MKYIYIYVSYFFLCSSTILVAQEKTSILSTLPLYTISNNELSLVVDSFIVECINKYGYQNHKDSLLLIMRLEFYNQQRQNIVLSLIKYGTNSDSLFLYENPYLKQAFIEKNGFLIFAKINANYFAFNHLDLEDFIMKTGLITVCLMDPPSNFYDIGIYGEIKYSDNLISWMIDFVDGKILEIVKINFYDND